MYMYFFRSELSLVYHKHFKIILDFPDLCSTNLDITLIVKSPTFDFLNYDPPNSTLFLKYEFT